eukprot:353239-Chlamydomonas_euryale.AAC.2
MPLVTHAHGHAEPLVANAPHPLCLASPNKRLAPSTTGRAHPFYLGISEQTPRPFHTGPLAPRPSFF